MDQQPYGQQQGYVPPQQSGYVPPPPPPPPQQPMYNNMSYMNDKTSPMTTGQFLIMFLTLLIPIANIVLLFIWSFGDSANINKRNLARAMLIWMAIAIVLSLVFSSIFTAIVGSFMESL